MSLRCVTLPPFIYKNRKVVNNKMNSTKHYNKFVKTFSLDPNRFHLVIAGIDTTRPLLRIRHTRFYSIDKEGTMVAPYELRQRIKAYFSFSFDKYLCRNKNNEICLTKEGVDLITGSITFPSTLKPIYDMQSFAHDTGLTSLGLETLLAYYELPLSVSGCKALLKMNDCVHYRYLSYMEKTPSRQWGSKKQEPKQRQEEQNIPEGIGVIVGEPRVTKKDIRIKVELENSYYELCLPLSMEGKGLLHTGTKVETTKQEIIISDLVTIPWTERRA